MDRTRWRVYASIAVASVAVGIQQVDTAARLERPPPVAPVKPLRPPHADGTIDLVVLAGQSNAQGIRANAAEYPPDPLVDRKIWFRWEARSRRGERFSGVDEWGILTPQAGGPFVAGHFGPEVMIARAYADAGRRVAVFKFTRAAADLHHVWEPGTRGALFSRFEGSLRRAIADLEHEGPVRPVCFVWIQGETDALNPESVLGYEDRLRRVVASARRQLGDIPIVLGAEESYTEAHDARVIEIQERVAREDPSIRRISMRNLEKFDEAHLTARGTIEQGKLIYRACTGS